MEENSNGKTNTLEKIETVYTYDEWLKEFVTYLCEQETEVARVNQLKRLETHRQKMKISRMEYVYYLKQKNFWIGDYSYWNFNTTYIRR